MRDVVRVCAVFTFLKVVSPYLAHLKEDGVKVLFCGYKTYVTGETATTKKVIGTDGSQAIDKAKAEGFSKILDCMEWKIDNSKETTLALAQGVVPPNPKKEMEECIAVA